MADHYRQIRSAENRVGRHHSPFLPIDHRQILKFQSLTFHKFRNQRPNRRSRASVHRTDTRPPDCESAPYFAALVDSSWNTIATACDAVCVRETAGPSTVVLVLVV